MPHECTDCGREFADGSKEMLSGCPDCGGNTFQFKPSGASTTDTGGTEEPPEPPEPAVDSTVARTVGNAATAVRDLVGSRDDTEAGVGPRDGPSPDGTGDAYGDEPWPGPAESRMQPETPTRETADSGRESPDGSSGKTGGEPTGEPSRTADSPSGAEPSSVAETSSCEDSAQASARTEVVSPEDLPPAPETPGVRERPAPVVDEHSEEAEDRPDLDELRDQLNQQFESIRVLAPGQYELNLMELYDREEYIIALQEDGKYTIQVPERWGE